MIWVKPNKEKKALMFYVIQSGLQSWYIRFIIVLKQYGGWGLFCTALKSAALFAVAHLTSTLATLSPEWCLSVTHYQLPTCHQQPLCFPTLCMLSLYSYSYVLSCCLFSLRIVSVLFCSLSPSLTLLAPSLFLSMSTLLPPPPLHPPPIYSNWFSLKNLLFLLPYPLLPTLLLILAFPSYSLSYD